MAKQLNERCVENFLPLYRTWHRWKDRRKQVELALFPGYVFVRIEEQNKLQVLKTPGAVNLVSFNGKLAPLPEPEIEALRNALEPVKDKMCADCQRRAVTNPLRVFDCKVAEDQPIIEKLPRISQFLDEGCRQHFAAVQAILTKVGVPFTLNDRLVRGLDYYTRTAFEFTHGALGAQNAILGGGRYDGLSEALGGPPAPGIGFAIGEDRLVMSLKQAAEAVIRKPDVYIAPLGAGMNREAAGVLVHIDAPKP